MDLRYLLYFLTGVVMPIIILLLLLYFPAQ